MGDDTHFLDSLCPSRAGHIRNHSRAAHPCSIWRRVEIHSAQMAILTLWIRILFLLFSDNAARVVDCMRSLGYFFLSAGEARREEKLPTESSACLLRKR